MFLGKYEHTIDDKGRVTLPAKFRPGLEGGVVTTLGLDGCLLMFPRAEWDKLASRIEALPTMNPDVRNFGRLMFANADDSKPDRQGRVLIPAHLRAYAKLENEVVITGWSSRFELWNPARWQEVQTKALDRIGHIAEYVSGLGI
mgnify:CR=1 FL=1